MMTRAVSSAAPNSSAQSVAQLMRTDGSDAVVLVNDGIPVALITDRDLALSVVAEDAGADRDALAYASSPVIAVGEDADVADAARLMSRHGISRVVVLDGGRLAGVVSAGDVAPHAGEAAPVAPLS